MIPLGELHIMWSRLSFSDLLSAESIPEFGIQQEINLLINRYKEVDITGKVTIKHKLREIVCPEQTSMIALMHKVKTKGAQKTRAYRFERSTKRDPSYFDHVDAFHDSHLGKKDFQSKAKARAEGTYEYMQQKRILMIDQFHVICHPYILDVVDVIANGHCGYKCIAALLGMGEDSWPLIRHDLFKELSQYRNDYARLLCSYDRVEELRKFLLVDSTSGVFSFT